MNSQHRTVCLDMIGPVRQDWEAALGQALTALGDPIFGLAGPHAGEGVVNGHATGWNAQVTLLYATPAGRVELTNGRHPLGGTMNLLRQILMRSVPTRPNLPWEVKLEERLVMLPVGPVMTQFRVIESSAGCWLAAGGIRKRHLLLAGSEGARIDGLALDLVTIDLGRRRPAPGCG